MTKNHLKRLNCPATWQIKRKGIKFITKPKPGQTSFKLGMPLIVIAKDMIKLAKTTKEAKYMITNHEFMIDNKRKKDPKYALGFMDVLTIPKIKAQYRMLLNKKGKLSLIKINEQDAKIKPMKITGKKYVKGKLQISFYNGQNILIEKDNAKVGDSAIIDLTTGKIKEYLKLEKGAYVFLIGGKHIGDSGIVEGTEEGKINYKTESGEIYETNKKFAFVIGKGKPIIML